MSTRGSPRETNLRNGALSRLGEGLEGRRNVTDERFRSLNRALTVFLPHKETQLKPMKVDFNKDENRNAHRTEDYESEELIIRRGQEFQVTVTFDRVYRPESDELILQFVTGEQPQESKGTIVRVTTRDVLTPTQWGMKIKEARGQTMHLTVMPSAKAIIGRYEVFLETKTVDSKGKSSVSRRKEEEIVCILFNAWCQDDVAYMDNEEERQEYVLADSGNIWVGSEWWNWGIPWLFGQFEDVALNCALWLLDQSSVRPNARSSPIPIVRVLSAQVNFDDKDGGLLVGRWEEPYDSGTRPTGWTGSVNILEEFWKTKKHVKYGQCWVFSGLVTTLLRALGLPTRSVTNFQSAHDNDRSLTIDSHYDDNDKPIKEWDDSVWNFHVWNESWFRRPDLPAGYDGWQVHDATPQETSQGVYRCGPASLKAIKNGEVYLPYDTGFIFAEVNGDRVRWEVNTKDGSVKAFVVDKKAIGKSISTKFPGENGDASRLDVTSNYKHKEGSEEERRAVEFAFNFSTRRVFDIYEPEESDVDFFLDWVNDVAIGSSFDVKVVAKNASNYKRTVNLNITSILAFYTGVPGKPLKAKKDTLHLAAKEEKSTILRIEGSDYFGKMVDGEIKLYVKGKVEETHQKYATEVVVELTRPKLKVEASPQSVKKDEKVTVTAFFKNQTPASLTNGQFHFEASGMLPKSAVFNYPVPIAVDEEARISATFTSKRSKNHSIVVSFVSDKLNGVRGRCIVWNVD